MCKVVDLDNLPPELVKRYDMHEKELHEIAAELEYHFIKEEVDDETELNSYEFEHLVQDIIIYEYTNRFGGYVRYTIDGDNMYDITIKVYTLDNFRHRFVYTFDDQKVRFKYCQI